MGRSVKYSSAALTGLKSYSDAVNARVEAYTAETYQCPWSQRSPQFMFSEFGLKQYYDAANTGCCDERIRPFASKPQYAEVSAAMTPKDCFREVVSIGCTNLEAPDKSIHGCASSVLETQFNVVCPQMCEQFRDLASSKSVGKHGEFSLVGKSTEEDWVVKYRLNDEVRQKVFDTCAGQTIVKDVYCEYGVIETKIMASLSDPDGCYCDCCGNNGVFAPPTHQWQNVNLGATLNSAIAVNPVLNTACKDGKISAGYGSWGDGVGSMDVSWVTDTSYHSDGVSHFIQRLGAIGDRDHSACCGFSFAFTGSDGCGWSGVYSGNVPRMTPLPSFSPAPGVSLGQYYNTITLNGVCNDSNKAFLNFTKSCIADRNEYYYKSGSTISWESSLNLMETAACNGCCGNGTLNATFNDGCNKTGSASWFVRRPAGSVAIVGHVGKCALKDGFYEYYEAPLYCHGDMGSFTRIMGKYANLASCDQALRGNVESRCSVSGGCSGKNCCYVVENGEIPSGRLIAAICVKGAVAVNPVCCVIGRYTYNGAWFQKGSDCCTHDGKVA